MKMKIVDVIRKTSDEQIATIIGAIVLQHTEGITAEEAIKLDYQNTLRELQREIEIDYKQTNADRICSMSDEELLDFICSIETYDEGSVKTIEGGSALCSVTDVENWLQSETEE